MFPEAALKGQRSGRASPRRPEAAAARLLSRKHFSLHILPLRQRNRHERRERRLARRRSEALEIRRSPETNNRLCASASHVNLPFISMDVVFNTSASWVMPGRLGRRRRRRPGEVMQTLCDGFISAQRSSSRSNVPQTTTACCFNVCIKETEL